MALTKNFAAMEARGSSGDSAARAALRSRIANPSSIRLEELQPNPRNPRYDIEDPEVRELAETLRRVGQLQPALVMPAERYVAIYPEEQARLGPQPWVVIVGNRRLAASRIAGRASLDVRVDSDLDTPDDVEDRILIENIQRKDLPPLLEAEQLQRRLSRQGETVRSVGSAVGKSHTYVQQRVDLLRMIPEFQEMFRRGEINIKTGRQLGIQTPEEQRAVLAFGPPFTVAIRRNNAREQDVAAVNPVSTAGDSTAGSPVTTAGAGDAVNPVSTAGATDADPSAGEPAGEGPARSGRTPTARSSDVESTRIAVSQWLDNAVAELDRTLPASGEGIIGAAFTDARRYISNARTALERAAG